MKMPKRQAIRLANRTFRVQRLAGLLLIILSLIALPYMDGDCGANVIGCLAGTWLLFSKRMLLLNGNEAVFMEYGLIDKDGKVL